MVTASLAGASMRDTDHGVITPQTRVPMGGVWALACVIAPGVFLAGMSYVKMEETSAQGKMNKDELKDFRNEVKGEFKEVKELLASFDRRITAAEAATHK